MKIRPSASVSRLTLLFLGLSLCLGSLSGCAGLTGGLTPPEVSLVDLKPLQGGNLEQRFEIKLRVLNPNDVALSSDGVDVVLNVNGKRFARAVSAESFTIPRLSDDTIVLVATTHLLDLFRQAVSLPEAGGLDYELRGKVHLADSPRSLRFTREGSLVPESLKDGF